jgi:hypothetical protein
VTTANAICEASHQATMASLRWDASATGRLPLRLTRVHVAGDTQGVAGINGAADGE